MTIVEQGAVVYEREVMLPRLLPVGPDEIAGTGPLATRRICALLARAMRAERNRGRAGHWTYSLSRHFGLLQALKAERLRLASEMSGDRSAKTRGFAQPGDLITPKNPEWPS